MITLGRKKIIKNKNKIKTSLNFTFFAMFVYLSDQSYILKLLFSFMEHFVFLILVAMWMLVYYIDILYEMDFFTFDFLLF